MVNPRAPDKKSKGHDWQEGNSRNNQVKACRIKDDDLEDDANLEPIMSLLELEV
jgi:hypothetical protein